MGREKRFARPTGEGVGLDQAGSSVKDPQAEAPVAQVVPQPSPVEHMRWPYECSAMTTFTSRGAKSSSRSADAAGGARVALVMLVPFF
jgi:hypothetical protein